MKKFLTVLVFFTIASCSDQENKLDSIVIETAHICRGDSLNLTDSIACDSIHIDTCKLKCTKK